MLFCPCLGSGSLSGRGKARLEEIQLSIAREIGSDLHDMLMRYGYGLIATGVLVWFFPFIPAHRNSSPASLVNRRARWGMLLQCLSYTVLWQLHFWSRPLPAWHATLSILLFLLAAALSWTSAQALIGQFRMDAALGADSRLIRSGPYGLVRHPIYTSMLLVLSATAIIIAPWPLFLLSLVLFVAGTEIRVGTEEKLLENRFGEEFLAFKREVPAYIPFLRAAESARRVRKAL